MKKTCLVILCSCLVTYANSVIYTDEFDDVDVTKIAIGQMTNNDDAHPAFLEEELQEQAEMEHLGRMAAEERIRELEIREQALKRQLQQKTACKQKIEKDTPYNVPAWPFYTLCFNQDNILGLDFGVQYAGTAFISGNESRDLSQLVFGEGDIYVKDILLAAQLVLDEKVRDFSGKGNAADNYIGRLANHQLHFDGSSTGYDLSFGIVRHFLDDHITIGVQIPFVTKKHSLKLTTSAHSIINESSTFRELYSDFQDFFVDGILASKGIAYNNNDTEQGIGDVAVFLTCNLPSKVYERLHLGFRGQIPTGKRRDTNKLWGVELGNGGFIELSAFGSVLFSEKRWFNPHFFAQVAYRFHSRLDRRIPERKQFDGSGAGDLSSLLALGEQIRGKSGVSFDEFDSSFKRFATQTARVSYQKGGDLYLQLGNIFKEFLFQRGFGDLYYGLRVQASDHVGNVANSGLFNRMVLTNNTSELEHLVGFDFSYQFDSYARLRAGVSYPFAGRNVAKMLSGKIALTVEF